MKDHIKRALISVFDKRGVEKLAKSLHELEYEIVSSSGTAQYLKGQGIPVKEIADLSGYPHILGGRVKTLHPSVLGGILARRDFQMDLADVEKWGIPLIDIVACNLYPFEEVAKKRSGLGDLIENIDIGGVTLIRAAAKNYRYVTIVTDPDDYEGITEELKTLGNVTIETRQRLALKAFARTATYDSIIHSVLKGTIAEEESFPKAFPIALTKAMDMKYGENPHQTAALYEDPIKETPFKQLGGGALSYNNILDADGAVKGIKLLSDFMGCVIIKHTTPCGMAIGESLISAYRGALASDPVSAYGGIIGFTREVDEEAALEVSTKFYEIIVAPSFAPKALEVFRQKKPNLRLLTFDVSNIDDFRIAKTAFGFLAQEDTLPPEPDFDGGEWIGEKRPDLKQDALVAWKAAALAKSNAIALAKDGATIAIASGFTSRVDAVKWAIEHAGEKVRGSIMASDGFFPFSDSVEAAAKAGIALILQPGGSKRDEEVKKACIELGVPMLLTKARTFRH